MSPFASIVLQEQNAMFDFGINLHRVKIRDL